MTQLSGHGGQLATAVARQHGIDTMFTLSGAHVFPMYDGAVKGSADGGAPMRLIDVRHEQSAVFAAEAMAKLTRTPGLAVLTAGPGVTNGVSGVASAHFNGSPLVVVGGRAPQHRWGTGALQELDHPPLLAPVTKQAGTVAAVGQLAGAMDDALGLASRPHRGPVFLDVPMDELFSVAEVELPAAPHRTAAAPDPEAVQGVARLLAAATKPVLVIGSDVWADGAEVAARRAAETTGVPVIANGMGRGVLPAGHPQLVTRARSRAFREADLVVVAGAPLDFRLGYGVFGSAQVCHLADAPEQLARHVELAGAASGDLALVLDELVAAWEQQPSHAERAGWTAELRATADAAVAKDAEQLGSPADPIHPARIYGELGRVLDDDAVVIGDGGDFVSFAGRYVEPRRPGCWLDPGPYGCLGTGLGYAIAARIARPSAQIVLLLGDGAAGFSLMDIDTLVRHELPVVMVVGNNGIWALEKYPMQLLYGYDVAAELRPQTRYDEVATALGADGELVTEPGEIGAALRRGFAAGGPYLINVITDPAVPYPRSTTGI